jgi:hypothetical protein
LLTCKDIHPCKSCRGVGLKCEACGGTGAASLRGDLSPFFCVACDSSGWDYSLEAIPTPIPA